MLILALVLVCSNVLVVVDTRLAIVGSSESSVLVRSGDRSMLWCQTSEPWFLCVWKGPNNVAITKTQAHDCNGNSRPGMRVTGRGDRCELDMSDVSVEDRGEYRCIMADREEVVTVDRSMVLQVGLAARVTWDQGDVVQYMPGDRILLTCHSSEGFPVPNLVIRSDSVGLTEETIPELPGHNALDSVPQHLGSSRGHRTVSVDSATITNNTLVTCHAEQRDAVTGTLVYNSSMAIIRLEEVVAPVALTECMDWWCEYQIFLFIMLVMAVLILISCCGMYFFFATRGKPYNAIMYNSEHGTWSREDNVKEVKEMLMEKQKPPPSIMKNNTSFIKQADIIRQASDLNSSLYSQVDKSKKTSPPKEEKKPDPDPLPPVLETNFDQTNDHDDSLAHRVITDFDSTINESTSFLSKDLANSTFQDDSRVQSPTDEEMDEELRKKYEEFRRRYLLTMTEEETETRTENTETTLEMIWRKYRSKNRSNNDLDIDDFEFETELKKYALHKYQLANMKNVKRLGRTYSKIVKDHLGNNPKLTVSESSVEFEVARPSSSLSFCNRSNASTPLPPRRDTPTEPSTLRASHLLPSQSEEEKKRFMMTMTEETNFKSAETRVETVHQK